MTILVKQFSSASIINLFGIGLALCIQILVLPSITNTEEYGMYRWIERTGTLFANILVLGLHRTYVKYHSDSTLNKSQFDNAIFARSTAIIIGTLTILTLAPWVLNQFFTLHYFRTEYYSIGTMSVGGIAFLMSLRIASTKDKLLIPLFEQNIVLRITLLLITILVFNGVINFTQMVLIYGWSFLLLGTMSLSRSWRGTNTKWNFSALSKPLLPKIRSYAKFTIFGSSVDIILATIDVQMLMFLTDFSSVGIYSLAFFFASTIDSIKRPLSQILAPKFSTYWNVSDIQSLNKLNHKSAVIQTIITASILIILITNIEWIFSFIPGGERFNESIPVIHILIIGRLISSFFGSNGELISTSPFFKMNLRITILVLVLTVLFNLIAIPSLGIKGVAISNVITLLLLNSLRSAFLLYKSEIIPFYISSILYVICISILLLFILINIEIIGVYKFAITIALLVTTLILFKRNIIKLL